MSSDNAAAAPLRAVAVATDLDAYEGLISAMEGHLGDAWGELTLGEAAVYLGQPEAEGLEFAVIAASAAEVEGAVEIGQCLQAAQRQGIRVIVVSADLPPLLLHQLMRDGADDFLPYPLPDGALPESLVRISRRSVALDEARPKGGGRDGIVLPVHALAGGAGSTTLAVNLAWELAIIEKTDAPKVCVMDFDLQFGGVATHLDLPRRDAVTELFADAAHVDDDALFGAMQVFQEKLHVLTAPSEILPLDLIGPAEVERLIETARSNFDYVLIDMPRTITQWSETVLSAATLYFSPLELDLRSAQNALRLMTALKAEDLPVEKLRFAINRAPKGTDLSGRARVKRFAESLDVKIELLLPDGGRPARDAADHGRPLADLAPKNPLRREIAKLARQIHDTNTAEAKAAA